MNDVQVELNKQSIEVLKDGQLRLEGLLNRIESKQEEMFNHFTDKYEKIFTELKDRLPRWAVYALTLLAMFLGAIGAGVLTG